MRRLTIALILLIGSMAATMPGRAGALWGDSEEAFGLDGSFRTVGAWIFNYDYPPFFGGDDYDQLLQGVLRLTASGRPSDSLSYEFHLVQDAVHSTAATDSGGGVLGGGGAGRLRYRAWDEASAWLDEEDVSGTLWLDRAAVKIAFPRLDLTLGRQAVTFGKAYFWNPLDVFLPFDPRQFDRDYKAGVDALRVDLPTGMFSGATVVAAAGRELDQSGRYADDHGDADASWYGSALIGRYYLNAGGWDLAVQGGKVYGGRQLGGGLTGEWRTIEIRAEAAYFWADDSPTLPAPLSGDLLEDGLTLVFGLGRRFENTLTIETEYLYNGGGEEDDLNPALYRFQQGALLHLSRHLWGATCSYDITPIIIGRVAAIWSLTDGSAQYQPTLTWSLSDNADLIAGISWNTGDRPSGPSWAARINSEFGTWSDLAFVEFKIYF